MEYIEFRKKYNIGYITLNRPDTGNTVSRAFAEELKDVSRQINDDEAIRVVIIAGSAGTFSRGGNVGDPESLLAADMASKAIAGLHVPVIAAIDGYALEAGLELALAADIRIAAEGSQFGLPEVACGSIPAGGGTQRLPRIVGKSKALEMILTADIIDANEAYRVGLVNRVVPSAGLAASVEALAEKIASKGPIAERYGKEAISKGMDMTLGQGLGLEADLSFLLQSTQDRAEGIDAFLKKRTPEFKGE
ncbi:MAG: enoyl-CoA hydratase-related protein [Dehalococcoidia bacterium]|nr:enoyl-CoA hydratase-related protein [Dehalococcoidia bacterium]